MDVIGIGVAVLDVVMAIDGRPGDDDVIRAFDRRVNVGGGVVVALATASRLGAATGLVDIVGDDSVGGIIRDCLARTGIDLNLMQTASNASSSIATVWSQSEISKRAIVFSPGTDRSGGELAIHATAEVDAAIRRAKILHLNGRHLGLARQAIDVAHRAETLVSYDGGAGRFRDDIVPLLRSADILIVAASFAREYYAFSRAGRVVPPDDELARWMQFEVGCQFSGVTFGRDGSRFANDDGDHWHQPARLDQPTIDATGCGDAFRGGVLAALAGGDDQRAATAAGAQAAAEMAMVLGSGLC